MMNDVTPFETKTSKLGIDASKTDEGTPVEVEASIFSARPETGSQPKLVWPPLKEDLERLYLEQKLSAMKIAKVYGLKYASDKTAESTILYHLKKNGIARRDPAAHNRKATAPVVDEWVRRYEAGESLKQIAGETVDHVTVWNHLRKRGVQLRDKVEAQIQAVTKHKRTLFKGDRHEMAYLVGLAVGDFASTRHGRAIRVRLGTTHPAMSRLFRNLFEEHGPIYEYPHKAQLTGFEWCLDCDLDRSFEFLLDMKETARLVMGQEDLFLDFLAGFFDAEGSIYYHKKGKRGAFELSIANTDLGLLQEISRMLEWMGVVHVLRKEKIDRERAIARGIKNPGEFIWRIQVWRYDDVNRLLRTLKLKHPEKTAKAGIALRLGFRPELTSRLAILAEWQTLNQSIEADCENYIARARKAWESKLSPDTSNEGETDSI